MGRCLKSYWVSKYSKVQFRHSVFTPQNIFFICCSEHSVLGISQEKSCECSESNIFHILGGSNSNIFQYLKQEWHSVELIPPPRPNSSLLYTPESLLPKKFKLKEMSYLSIPNPLCTSVPKMTWYRWGWVVLHPCFMEIHSVFVFPCWRTHQPTNQQRNGPTIQQIKETNQNTFKQINTPNNQPTNENNSKHSLCSGDVKKSERWVLKPVLKDSASTGGSDSN